MGEGKNPDAAKRLRDRRADGEEERKALWYDGDSRFYHFYHLFFFIYYYLLLFTIISIIFYQIVSYIPYLLSC